MAKDNRAVAARMYELFDAGDVAGLDTVLDPGLIDHNPVPGTSSGIDGMRALVAAIRDGFSDTHHEVLYQGDPGDGWVVSHWRMTGTHTGDWFGTPATGRPVSITGTDIMRVDHDKVVEIRHVEELLQLQQQLAGAAS
jgi:predicted ester cyclase